MRDLFKKIKRCNKTIEKIASSIVDVEILPYYETFHMEKEQERDRQTYNRAMRTALSEKQAHLETLQLEINKELHKISQAQKIYTLQTNGNNV